MVWPALAVFALTLQSASNPQYSACDLTQFSRDTMRLSVYASAPPRKRFEPAAEYEFRERQAQTVIRLIDSVSSLSLPAFIGTAVVPDNADDYRLLDLEGEVWFQVRDDGRLIGLKLKVPTGSPELNQALLAGVAKADSLRLLSPLPKKLRGKAIDLLISVQTSKPAAPAVILAFVTIPYVPIESSVELLPGYQRPRMPPNAFTSFTGDSLVVDFVINAEGAPEMQSLVFRRIGWRDFGEEVLKSLSTMRFKPAMSRGCRVPQRVCQPWHFTFRQ